MKKSVFVWGLCILFILTSCSKEASLPDQQEPITLRVASMFEESQFKQRYSDLFEYAFEHITVEHVPLKETVIRKGDLAEIEQYLTENEIDLLHMRDWAYRQLSNAGLLSSIESKAHAELALEHFVQPVIELLREYGNGELKGLSPSFHSSALYYNEDLFGELRISHPEHFMSWEEVLDLAAEFSGHERHGQPLVGYTRFDIQNNLFQFIHTMAMTENIPLLDEDGSAVAINNPDWLDLSERAVTAFQTGAIGAKEYEDGVPISLSDYYRLFLDGEAAMVVASHSFMENLEHVDFSWSFVTQPVHSSDRQTAEDLKINEIFGIHPTSKSMEAAWEFIKHVHSDGVMRLQSLNDGIPSRIAYASERLGHDLSPFYNIQANSSHNLLIIEMPEDFLNRFLKLANEHFYQVLHGEWSVQEALSQLEQSGQEILDEFRME